MPSYFDQARSRRMEYVYTLPNFRGKLFHHTAAKESMSDEGPVPMKDLKPADKKPTGAEQFLEEHQNEHESPADDGNRLTHVLDHNSAFPQLKDELGKRQSTIKVTALSGLKQHTEELELLDDDICDKCLREKKRAEKNKTIKDKKCIKRKKRGSEKKLRSRSRPRSRVAKFRRPIRKRMLAALMSMKIKRTISCQCFAPVLTIGTSPEQMDLPKPILLNMADANMAGNALGLAGNVLGSFACTFDKDERDGVKSSHDVIEERNRSKSASKSEIASEQYPNTTDPSVSSYNSFMSMDHEPMVTQ